MPKVYSRGVREEFFELLCGGMSAQAAASEVGVSSWTGVLWWRSSGLVDLSIQSGRRGGLPGTAPAAVPGDAHGRERVSARCRRALTSQDRAVIAVLLRQEMSCAQIGAVIGRDKTVVWREVRRNRGRDGSYYAPVADRAAHERRRRPKPFKLVQNPVLCRAIEGWMDVGWSPGLIATMLRRDHPDAGAGAMMGRVCHETIYQALYVQPRGLLRRDLHRQLSLQRAARKPRGQRRENSPYRHAYTISQRPAEVNDRAVPGHWEGDLITGAANGSAVGTLVERATRFTILLHLPGRHDADTVAAAMITQMRDLPEHLRRSLTWDRGTELAEYERIQLHLGMPVYFCDPHSPWQRGSNENTNRLLRFWLTKGSDLSVHTADDLDRIAATLNRRPRPTLNLKTPAQALAELLANPAAA